MPTKKAKKTVDPTIEKETKAQRFVRLAQSRTSKAVKAIYGIGMLGANNYESTTDQREKINAALTAAVESTMNKLNKETVRPLGFTL